LTFVLQSDKGHCKILWDDDDDDFEFDEYYEFPEEKENKNYVTGVNALGELLLSDGTVLGNREMVVYYRQKLRPLTDVQVKDQEIMRQRLTAAAPSSNALVTTSSGAKSSALTTSVGVLKFCKRLSKLEKKRYDKAKDIEFKKNLKVGQANNHQKHFREQYLF
jgi:hypothetical protein